MWRFVVALLIFTLIGSIGLGKLFDALNEHSQQNQEIGQQQSLASQAQLTQIALQQLSAQQQLSFLNQAQQQLPNFEFAIHALTDYPLPQALLSELKVKPTLVLETQQHLQAYALLSNNQVLIINTLKEQFDESTNLLMTMSFYAALMTLILLFLAPFILRLRRLSVATAALGKGDLSQRVPVGSVWYLKALETDFNAMATRIEALMNDIKLLASGLSHELRTPLARVRMGLDTLVESDDETLSADYEQRINANLDTMEDLVNQLLSFARLQYTLEDTPKAAIDLNLVVQAIEHKLASPILSVHYSASPAIIWADKHYLTMCINNLLANALNYCQQRVTIHIECSEQAIRVSIADDGAGIPPAERDNIFKPFVRLNKQSQQGYGVGLAFVERIVSWLNGKITVTECPILKGAQFTLQFNTSK
ncbi:two-component sensor histidine kinase [Pseudoalteromonas sp. JBTF-M23]|uniref:histidine kinase n=1 Tax=Pseudoalteromonas caenipelagi TaxID=2726988 RepID=A0A849VHX8_9GAMM|nr:ATP-binding protein [Pseudoalteromonas caenipelagi]NOU51454.1 two-component sensor histidine kinase [Pseudoalteromonas caenipelagi]